MTDTQFLARSVLLVSLLVVFGTGAPRESSHMPVKGAAQTSRVALVHGTVHDPFVRVRPLQGSVVVGVGSLTAPEDRGWVSQS